MLLLGTDSGETETYGHKTLFIAILAVTITCYSNVCSDHYMMVSNQKQLKCLSAGEEVSVVYLYSGILLNNEIINSWYTQYQGWVSKNVK